MNAPASRVRLVLARAEFTLDIDLALPERGITVLYGRSGSGKTSVLRCVAGLERAREARVQIGGEVWQDEARGVFLPAWRRPVGFVFQEPSLFEHLDVRGNLRFAQERSGAAQDRAALEEVIALLGIEALLERRPAALSGGERQRVAIARALASRPRVLLLDEPLASIDPSRRREILPWLERLHDELRTPMLYVTHAADEMARLADQLVVLERGRVIASGPVAEVLASTEGHASMGEEAGALLDGVITAHDAAWALARVNFDGGQVWMRDNGLPLGHRVRLRVLARDASIATVEPSCTSIQNQLRGRVEAITPGAHPAQALVRVRCGGSTVLARLTRRAVDSLGLQPGHAVWVQVKSVAIIE